MSFLLELYNFVNRTESESTARGKLGTIICKLRKHFLRSPKFVPIGKNFCFIF